MAALYREFTSQAQIDAMYNAAAAVADSAGHVQRYIEHSRRARQTAIDSGLSGAGVKSISRGEWIVVALGRRHGLRPSSKINTNEYTYFPPSEIVQFAQRFVCRNSAVDRAERAADNRPSGVFFTAARRKVCRR
jgi:hypothetical protein